MIGGILSAATSAAKAEAQRRQAPLIRRAHALEDVAGACRAFDPALYREIPPEKRKASEGMQCMGLSVGHACGGSGTSTFDPSTIAWSAWYRETVVITSSKVSQWTDLSGNGRHLTQSSSAFRPVVGSPLNGQPTILFTAANHEYIDGTANSVTFGSVATSSAFTAFLVVKPASFTGTGTGGSVYLNTGFWGDSAQYVGLYGVATAPTFAGYNYHGGSVPDLQSQTVTTGTYYLVELRHDAGNLVIRVNQNSEVSAASGTTDVTTGTLNIGHGGSANYLDGTVAELAFANTVLDATTRANYRSYISSRYAIF